MKSQEQNRKEAESYLRKSSTHLFSNGNEIYQTVKLARFGYVRILFSLEENRPERVEVIPIHLDSTISSNPTDSKHILKRELHSTNMHENRPLIRFTYQDQKYPYTMPNNPLQSVRYNRYMREKISKIVSDYETKMESSHNI